MTVCIAVLPRGSDAIILVSDELLSSEVTSVDGVLKWAPIVPGLAWYVMDAGHAPRFQPLIRRVRDLLGDVKNTRLTLETVTQAFERAFAIELTGLVEKDILLPYGLPHGEFMRKGRRLLGEVRFNKVMDQIVRADLGIEVLVAGLDAWTNQQLFSVSSGGLITPAVLPYHAIGAGAFLALGTLYSLAHYPAFGSDLADTVYRACAAKFAAEAAPGVGKSTHAMVVSPMAGTWALLMDVDRLRDLWQTRGQPPVPGRARVIIKRDLRALQYIPRNKVKSAGRLTRGSRRA